MHLPELISDLAIILLTGGIVTLIFRKLNQPLVLWPSLSFSTNHGVSYRPGQDADTYRDVDGEIVTTPNTTVSSSYGINMNWTVWNGGINHKNVKAQEVANEIIELNTETSELNIQERR